jgi:alpha-methylacyl-CoA racemase
LIGPLAGVRVIELAGIGPIQLDCTLLADLGADVVRVERPGGQVYVPPEREVLHREVLRAWGFADAEIEAAIT